MIVYKYPHVSGYGDAHKRLARDIVGIILVGNVGVVMPALSRDEIK